MSPACSCGDPAPHVVMRRRTADDIEVCLWDDGAVTGAMGYGIRGVPMRRPRTAEAIDTAKTAGALPLGAACLYDAAELGEPYFAAEAAARLDGLPGTMRRILRERQERASYPLLNWAVLSADRSGRPTERVARLDRIRWPGLVVWDYCAGPGSAGGRYVLCNRVPGAADTYTATGFAFRCLADLWDHLRG